MKTRSRRNFLITVIFVTTIVLTLTTVYTMFAGFNRVLFSNEVVESNSYASYNAQARVSADNVYEDVDAARNKLYNAGGYTQWLYESSKGEFIIVGVLLMALTIFCGNISWNVIKRLAKIRG